MRERKHQPKELKSQLPTNWENRPKKKKKTRNQMQKIINNNNIECGYNAFTFYASTICIHQVHLFFGGHLGPGCPGTKVQPEGPLGGTGRFCRDSNTSPLFNCHTCSSPDRTLLAILGYMVWSVRPSTTIIPKIFLMISPIT